MRAEALLRSEGVAPAPAGLVALVLAEALNNVAEHAFADIRAEWIDIDLTLDGPRVEITILDRGAALPGLPHPSAAQPRLDGPRADIPEGGFGWFLIRQLTTDIRYFRHEGTNRLTLVLDMPSLSRASGTP